MTNRFVLSILAASLLVVLSVAIAYAGSAGRFNITFPFAFTVGNVSFPSGDYTVSESNADGLLLLQNRNARLSSIS
jgi:hypothetical protein